MCFLDVELLIKVGGQHVCNLQLNLVNRVLVMKRPLFLISVVEKI